MTRQGRVTLPVEVGIDDEVRQLMQRLGADAVRNSDGTELPQLVHELAAKVYSTYFPARGNQEWALAHPDTVTNLFVQSPRKTALESDLTIDVLEGYMPDQVEPETEVDLDKYWEVHDRTTGRRLDASEWELVDKTHVRIGAAEVGHVYTVNYLARQIWDSTQIYNYLTNNWEKDPTRVKERPYNVVLPVVWEQVMKQLGEWLDEHDEVDVVRFTTFFYHFTLVFNEHRKEKFVDWFGYSASVSVTALEAFEAEYGYALTPEDFIDQGFYNSIFRQPTQRYRDWIDFQHRFVTSRVREMTDAVHAAGKEAMMFLGDTWMGVEPYGPHFKDANMDAVVGSVGNAATCRMIADIPHVKYTEGRFLPYFFPDVFNHEGGDPVGEANMSWMAARRAIVRAPLDRIGYGGYLSLVIQFPEFVDRMEAICQEFRDIFDAAEGKSPQVASVRVAIVNAWGKLRTWQTHMVAHALPFEQTEAYVGVIEALAGQGFDVRFISFDDVLEGALDDVDVLINVGEAGTAFSGGDVWLDEKLQVAVRKFVANGGGIIGVGEPCAVNANGAFNQLSDVFGVDREQSWSLSTDRYPNLVDNHFITGDNPDLTDKFKGGARFWVNADEDVEILWKQGTSVHAAAKQFGRGRSVYFAGLKYCQETSRMLERAIFWAARKEHEYEGSTHCEDPRIEVATYDSGAVFAYNSSLDAVKAVVRNCKGEDREIDLEPLGSIWL